MKTQILHTLAYFDIFNHPLKKEELELHYGEPINGELKEFIKRSIVSKKGEYYGLNQHISQLISQREENERRAELYFKKAPFYIRIMSKFPFVRAIGISGSLSKNVINEDGDIDYFIITEANRLWICRTLLVLFKKVALLNSRKYFCVNYFIDTNNLEIKDKNVFTAIELSYLLPVYNSSLIEEFKNKNSWSTDFISKFEHPIPFNSIDHDSSLKSAIEKTINLLFPDRLDAFFMRLTYKRWQQKFKHFDAKKMALTMRSNRGISKHHPSDFQTKVLEEYEKRINRLNKADESTIYT